MTHVERLRCYTLSQPLQHVDCGVDALHKIYGEVVFVLHARTTRQFGNCLVCPALQHGEEHEIGVQDVVDSVMQELAVFELSFF